MGPGGGQARLALGWARLAGAEVVGAGLRPLPPGDPRLPAPRVYAVFHRNARRAGKEARRGEAREGKLAIGRGKAARLRVTGMGLLVEDDRGRPAASHLFQGKGMLLSWEAVGDGAALALEAEVANQPGGIGPLQAGKLGFLCVDARAVSAELTAVASALAAIVRFVVLMYEFSFFGWKAGNVQPCYR